MCVCGWVGFLLSDGIPPLRDGGSSTSTGSMQATGRSRSGETSCVLGGGGGTSRAHTRARRTLTPVTLLSLERESVRYQNDHRRCMSGPWYVQVSK